MSWLWWFEMEDVRMIIDTGAGVFVGIAAWQLFSFIMRKLRRG